MKKILTIAGSDCSGGAGIQADIKTVTAHGMYAMSVITALTAQNTMEVSGILDVPPEFVGQQLDSVFTDIIPDCIKIGMVSNSDIIKIIASKLKQYKAGIIVLDPVMVSTSGSRLLSEEAQDTLLKELFPIAALLTPNIPEAQVLTGKEIKTKQQQEQAAVWLGQNYQTAVLVKGGHNMGEAEDVLWENGAIHWFRTPRVNNNNTHGTGCTLSSAIACQLAKGETMKDSISMAKEYITGALKEGVNLGHGSGPLNHGYLFNVSNSNFAHVKLRSE